MGDVKMPYNHTRDEDEAQRDLEAIAAKLMHYFGIQRGGTATKMEEGMYDGLSDAFGSFTGVNPVALTMAMDHVNNMEKLTVNEKGKELLRQLSLPGGPTRLDVISSSGPRHATTDGKPSVAVHVSGKWGARTVLHFTPTIAGWLFKEEPKKV